MNTTTVTHPDGTTSTRTSKSRTYSHAVVCGPMRADVAATERRLQASALRLEVERLRAAAAAGVVKVKSRGLVRCPDRVAYVATLAGTGTGTTRPVDTWCDAEGSTTDYLAEADRSPNGTRLYPATDVQDYLPRCALDTAGRLEVHAGELEAEATALLKGEADLGGWSVVRWSSRADLAVKAAEGELAYLQAQGHTLQVVAVDQLGGRTLEDECGACGAHVSDPHAGDCPAEAKVLELCTLSRGLA